LKSEWPPSKARGAKLKGVSYATLEAEKGEGPSLASWLALIRDNWRNDAVFSIPLAQESYLDKVTD